MVSLRTFGDVDDLRHPDTVEEWVFAAWTADGDLGVLSGHRIVGRRAWYWAALARSGRPLLHITDFEVPVRADPFIVKGEALWAEHTCDAPMEQWSIGNETYASAIEDTDDALGLGYGTPTPIAFDLEWYATAPPQPLQSLLPPPKNARFVAPSATNEENFGTRPVGYEQAGVVHGAVEILNESTVELAEVPAHRWHRWSSGHFGPLTLPEAVAHTGVRAPFTFPDGSVSDLVVTPEGWARRADRRRT